MIFTIAVSCGAGGAGLFALSVVPHNALELLREVRQAQFTLALSRILWLSSLLALSTFCIALCVAAAGGAAGSTDCERVAGGIAGWGLVVAVACFAVSMLLAIDADPVSGARTGQQDAAADDRPQAGDRG